MYITSENSQIIWNHWFAHQRCLSAKETKSDDFGKPTLWKPEQNLTSLRVHLSIIRPVNLQQTINILDNFKQGDRH